MSYRIEYDGEVKKYSRNRVSHLGRYTLVVFLTFLLFVNSCWPAGREALNQILFPGDSNTVEAALVTLADSLQAGNGPIDAVEAFCREILDHGAAYDQN